MRKILLLGGSAQQVVAIETAKRLGYHTILCDYLTDNPGQYVADKFYLVSTTDMDAVLEVATKEEIDGVIAYASDPAAPTAAYVAEKLGLPTNPYQSVKTLCNKDLFREFLEKNGYSVPHSIGCSSPSEALAAVRALELPVIIKPVDSSGSKGCTVLRALENVEEAVNFAFSFSRCQRIIVEEYIEKKHPYLIGGDIFVYEGKVIQWGLMNCHRDTEVNPLVPVGKSYPPELAEEDLNKVKSTLQSLVDKLHFAFGAMNVELVIDSKDRVWPIDIGPRSGGNMIPDLLGLIFNTDVVEMSVKAAMGEKLSIGEMKATPYYATHNLHTKNNGVFQEVLFSDEIKPYIVRSCVYKTRGEKVEYFDNASKAIGIVFMKFEDRDTRLKMLDEINLHIMVCVGTDPE